MCRSFGGARVAREWAPRRADLLQKGVEKIFSLFAKVDQNSNGMIDAQELSAAMAASDTLKTRLCEVAGVSPDGPLETLVAAVMRKADTSENGSVEAAELEALLRGWQADSHATISDMTAANERRRLAGAAERAERNRVEAGGKRTHHRK